MVGVCLLFLVAGFALKAQCIGPLDANNPWSIGAQYQRLCYNDLQPLYGARGVSAHVFPYVDGALVGGELINGAIEYPVLTGVFMWASGLPTSDINSYLVLSALLLAPFGLAVAYLLGRMVGMRALLWSAAPGLVLYAFHNWDLLAVAAAIVGLYMWRGERPYEAAVAFGIGAAFKLFPLFFLGPLFLYELHAGRPRRALATAGLGAGTFAVINLPFALANFDGWWATYAFHRARQPNLDSIWWLGWGGDWSPARFNAVTSLLLAATFVAILAFAWLRARREGEFPFLAACGALLAAFLLFNKVHSPQYTLWLLPFFALLRVRVVWWAAYAIVDLAVYVGVFRWFYDFSRSGSFDEFTAAKRLMTYGVWGRAVLLAALVAVFAIAKEALLREREEVAPAPLGDRPPVLP